MHRPAAILAPVALLAVFLLPGCAAQLVRQRAAFDLSCPEAQIELVDAGGGGTIGAIGCGKKASYVFVSGVGWVLNSQVHSSR
jgi:hypothetical protein